MLTRYTLLALAMLIVVSAAHAERRTLTVPRPPPSPRPVAFDPPPGRMASDPAAVVAVMRMLTAYSSKDLPGFGQLLTADFRFHSGDGPDGVPFEFTREDELSSAKHLFEGVVRASGERLPAARRIRFHGGPFSSRPDVDHSDSLGRFMVVLALHITLEVVFEDGSALRTEPTSHLFHLVRGDAATLAGGGRATQAEWFVREWTEGPAISPAIAAAMSEPQPGATGPPARADSADTSMAAEKAAEVPLALSPLQNPSRGVIGLAVGAPARGPARLEAFDVAGRRVMARELVVEKGVRLMTLEPALAMRPGVYWLRLSHANQAVTARVVLVR